MQDKDKYKLDKLELWEIQLALKYMEDNKEELEKAHPKYKFTIDRFTWFVLILLSALNILVTTFNFLN